jgi:hypothetical protein
MNQKEQDEVQASMKKKTKAPFRLLKTDAFDFHKDHRSDQNEVAVLACTRSNRDLYPEASLRGARSPVSI